VHGLPPLVVTVGCRHRLKPVAFTPTTSCLLATGESHLFFVTDNGIQARPVQRVDLSRPKCRLTSICKRKTSFNSAELRGPSQKACLLSWFARPQSLINVGSHALARPFGVLPLPDASSYPERLLPTASLRTQVSLPFPNSLLGKPA